MENGISIRDFDGLTAGSESLSRDVGVLLPDVNPPTRDVDALTGDVEA
jgi:hypothetical protein